jgi:hypothetical protein
VTLRRRLEQLEGAMQKLPAKMLDLSKYSDEELAVIEKVCDFAVVRHLAGRGPLQADLSWLSEPDTGLSEPEMAIYRRIAEREGRLDL